MVDQNTFPLLKFYSHSNLSIISANGEREWWKDALKRKFGVDFDRDRLDRYGCAGLHILFHPNISFPFRFTTANDGFPKFRVRKRKRDMDEVNAIENDRQIGYRKVWDTVSSDYGKGLLVWKCAAMD